MIDLDEFNNKLQELSNLITLGKFHNSYLGVMQLINELKEYPKKNDVYYQLEFSIAGLLIDIGAMQPNKKASELGLEILEKNRDPFLIHIEDHEYYYCLSNALTNFTEDKGVFDVTFTSIEALVEIKTYLRKAIKSSAKIEKLRLSEYNVNLGIALKKQYRIVEAIRYYDRVNLLDLDIPQSWLNRSESLIMLNTISGSYSIQMLEQIKRGYEEVIKSKETPPQWINFYNEKIAFISKEINTALEDKNIKKIPHNQDEAESKREFHKLGKFRQFCLTNDLTLTEHGLYCRCAASTRDDLSIIGVSISGRDEIIAMEMVLNRIKSEFSLARRNYYEYFLEEDHSLFYEECYSEIYNDELLGLNIEKLRSSFRLCFGILDKIAVATCELYDLYPGTSKDVSFQSFWRLDNNDRRDKFEKIKNPGLLALYSIATDLNAHKGGELSFFKDYRNSLEHSFVIIHNSNTPTDLYQSNAFFKNAILIKESDFIQNLDELLQLTKSAIFSFVFMVRGKSFQEESKIRERALDGTRKIKRQDKPKFRNN